MERQRIAEYSHRYFLNPGECTPEGEMPLTLVLTRIIEVATEHDDILGIGYANLIKENQAWVLTRVSIELDHLPKVSKKYTLVTWIEDCNRRFAKRCFEFLDNNGNSLGFAKTMWMIINSNSRECVDISMANLMQELKSSKLCPIAPHTRLSPVTTGKPKYHSFKYCDLDINHHVNSVRYVELLLNQIPLSKFEANAIARFEIQFLKECHYSKIYTINVDDTTDDIRMEISQDGTSHCRSRIVFRPREGQTDEQIIRN